MTRVLLAGGGHAHLIAAPRLAALAGGRAKIALLAPSPRLLYSGMMPGWLAGTYPYDACAIDLRAVARAAGLEWIEDALVDVDFRARSAIGASGRRHRFDRLSLNVGADVDPGRRADGAAPTVLSAKPFDAFVAGFERWLAAAPPRARCVVAGGGAAAVELAFALAARIAREPSLVGARVVLACAGGRLLPGHAALAAGLAERSLRARGVAIRLGVRFEGVEGDAALLRADPTPACEAAVVERLPAALVIVATGGRPPAWLAAAARRDGLPVAADGGLAVDPCLRSTGDATVHAAGDCASFVGSAVPRSGVHALRQGVPLAESIAAGLAAPGAPCAAPGRYVAQRRALALLNRGDGTAIASWGPMGAAGPAFWRLKDRIDRRFVARFADRRDGGPV